MAGPFEVVTGIVEGTNERGLKIRGQESWFNYSKYHRSKRDGTMLPRGVDWCMADGYRCAEGKGLPSNNSEISVTVDNKGWIQDIEMDAPAAAVPVRANPTRVATAPGLSGSDKDEHISRQAMLKVAAQMVHTAVLSGPTPAVVSVAEVRAAVMREADSLMDYLSGGHRAMKATAPAAIPPAAPENGVGRDVAIEGDLDFDELFGPGGGDVFAEEPDISLREFVGAFYALGKTKSDLAEFIGVDMEKLSEGAIGEWQEKNGKSFRTLLQGMG